VTSGDVIRRLLKTFPTARLNVPPTGRGFLRVSVNVGHFGDPIIVQFGDPITVQFGDPIIVQFGDPIIVQFGDPITVQFNLRMVSAILFFRPEALRFRFTKERKRFFRSVTVYERSLKTFPELVSYAQIYITKSMSKLQYNRLQSKKKSAVTALTMVIDFTPIPIISQ
jgi:hypothetical protein